MNKINTIDFTIDAVQKAKDMHRNLLRGARLDSVNSIVKNDISLYRINNYDSSKVTIVAGREGTSGLQIVSAAGDNTKYIGPFWKAQVETGETYTASVYAKGAGVLYMEVIPSDGTNRIGKDGNKATSSTSYSDSNTSHVTDEWKLYSLTFEVPSWSKGYVEVNMFNTNSAASDLMLTQPKLEAGDTPTAFSVNEDDQIGETGPKGDPNTQYIIECSNETPNITNGPVDVTVSAYKQTGQEKRELMSFDSGSGYSGSTQQDGTAFVSRMFTNPMTLRISNGMTVTVSGPLGSVTKHITPVKDGAAGKSVAGRVLYPAGEWDSKTTYTRTETAAPYVYHASDKKYYYLNVDSTTKEPEDGDATWKAMDQFNVFFAKIGIIANGTIGSAVFSGDYMFSMTGDLNEVAHNDEKGIYIKTTTGSTDYQYFDPAYPTGELGNDVLVMDHVGTKRFSPNIAINFNTGVTYMNQLHARGELHAGSIKHDVLDISNSSRYFSGETINQAPYQVCKITATDKDIIFFDTSGCNTDYLYRIELPKAQDNPGASMDFYFFCGASTAYLELFCPEVNYYDYAQKGTSLDQGYGNEGAIPIASQGQTDPGKKLSHVKVISNGTYWCVVEKQ